MATQKDNLAELAKLGITNEASAVEGILPLKGDESATEVASILKNAKAILKKSGNEGDEAENAEGVLVWIKGRSYVSDTERVDAGLYRLPAVPERLAKSPTSVVEVFADAIPPRKMTEIAKFMGVTHPEDFDDKDLLAKIVNPHFKTF